ncbi:MAG: hypothetical protein AAB693_01395 [Patescibacteria group bacterium]
MDWSLKRQFFFLLILTIFFLILGFLVFNLISGQGSILRDPKGRTLHTNATLDQISIIWARSFKIVPGRYNAVAYIENHNKNYAVTEIFYKFRFSDKNNIYIGKREGKTFIPPSGKFAIFEPGIDLGNSIPIYTNFEFTTKPNWFKIPEEKINQLKVFISDINLEDETSYGLNATNSPKLSAKIKNYSLFTIPQIKLIAILYDELGNAISASSTYIEELKREEESEVIFTWPETFSKKVFKQEIIPMYDIFSVLLK